MRVGARAGRSGSWAAAGLLALLACGPGAPDGAPEGAAAVSAAEEARAPAPDFTLPDLAGNPVRLADFRGKTVILDFWATWCPPCEFQVPELNKLSAAHRERGDLVVIGVSVDSDGASVVAPWIAQHGVEYTVVLGSVELAQRFGAVGFPTLAVVTPDGRIDSLHVGLVEYAALEQIVAQVLAARST
jgi:peroxiredoxin